MRSSLRHPFAVLRPLWMTLWRSLNRAGSGQPGAAGAAATGFCTVRVPLSLDLPANGALKSIALPEKNVVRSLTLSTPHWSGWRARWLKDEFAKIRKMSSRGEKLAQLELIRGSLRRIPEREASTTDIGNVANSPQRPFRP